MSIKEDSFFINAVPPFDFDEINEDYCWDGSDDEGLLQDLDTMVCVEIQELNESLPIEHNQDKSIIDYTIQLNKKKYDPFHITLPSHLKKRYQCDICFKTYANIGTLTRHKQRHKNFKCEICNDEFNAKTPLSRHMAVFHKKTVPCDFCAKKFYTIQQLAEHFEKKHDKELRDEEQENMNMEEINNSSQPKNSLDSELKLTLDSFLTNYKKSHDFSKDFSETKNVTDFSKYPQKCTSSSPPGIPIWKSESPIYTPNSPKYSTTSPEYTVGSPKYAPAPEFLECTPGSAKYVLGTPNSPNYPNSPNHTSNFPNYTSHSLKCTSNSPKLSFNEEILSDLPEIKLPEKNAKPTNSPKPQKTTKDYFKKSEKH